MIPKHAFVLALFFTLFASCIYRLDPQTTKLRKYAASDYLSGALEKPKELARPVFRNLINRLIQIGPDASMKSKMAAFERCVFELNQIPSIETVERDIFMGVVEDIGVIVDLDKPQFDRLQELRGF